MKPAPPPCAVLLVQQNTVKENARLQWGSSGHVVPRQNSGISFLVCSKIRLKLGIDFFDVCEDIILEFPCDCVAVLPSIERSKPLLFERQGIP